MPNVRTVCLFGCVIMARFAHSGGSPPRHRNREQRCTGRGHSSAAQGPSPGQAGGHWRALEAARRRAWLSPPTTDRPHGRFMSFSRHARRARAPRDRRSETESSQGRCASCCKLAMTSRNSLAPGAGSTPASRAASLSGSVVPERAGRHVATVPVNRRECRTRALPQTGTQIPHLRPVPGAQSRLAGPRRSNPLRAPTGGALITLRDRLGYGPAVPGGRCAFPARHRLER
jgi:hypothetical protein